MPITAIRWPRSGVTAQPHPRTANTSAPAAARDPEAPSTPSTASTPARFFTPTCQANTGRSIRRCLVRPYRVGMSCGFCHVGPSPIHPPADPENPQWENLNSTVGAQYSWFDRIWVWSADPSNFTFQLVHTSRPGALDTSLVSTDSIVNPRTMNAFYNLAARMGLARRWGHEILAGPELNNKQFNDYIP